MKAKPIIFSTKMIQVLLNTKPDVWPAERIDTGKPFKSMTRRVINPRYRKDEVGFQVCTNETRGERWLEKYDENEMSFSPPRYIESLYLPGDILWVRETFASTDSGEIIYKADPIFDDCTPGDFAWNWKPSIHMRREAARIFLKVKAVRVERLQAISHMDCFNEGIDDEGEDYAAAEYYQAGGSPIQGGSPECFAFVGLWNSIYAKRGYGWDSNPWVWVYEFMRIEKQEG